jgi:hypothetical protein
MMKRSPERELLLCASAREIRLWLTVLTAAFALATGWPAPVRGDDRPIVGAIRWDAWYGDGGPVAEVERSLGPRKFHFRLPFFARVVADDKVSINGAAPGVVEKEIACAADAGLNYWAFVDYGDEDDLTIARRRYQAARDKRGLRFCFIEEGSRIEGQAAHGWTRLISFFQDPNYQTVLGGRPLLFLFGRPKKAGKKEFQELGDAAVAAGGKRPYLVFMGFAPQRDAQNMEALGLDAVSAYAAGGQYRGEMWSYAQLTEHVWRNYWEVCRQYGIPTITFATMGWDTRPRLEHPVSWMPGVEAKPDPTPPAQQKPLLDEVTATPSQLARHLQDALEWTRNNRALNPANVMIIYAWNENDEGGWLIPTLSEGTARLDAIARVLNPKER